MVRLKKPSPQFWLRISPCVIYIECISAGLSSGSEGYSREKSLRFELEGLPCCFICILRCALDVHYKKEEKKESASETDCLRLFLPGWKLAQIRGRFSLQAARELLHEQINTQNRSLQKQREEPVKQDADSCEAPAELSSFMPDAQ